VDLRVIGEDAGVAVADDRSRLPRCPEAVDHFHPFIRHLVPQIVLMVAFQAEILRRPVIVRGNQVQPDAAMRQVVQRRAETGSEKGRVEGGRHRRDDANPAAGLGEQRHQRHRVALRHRRRVAQIPLGGSAERVRHKRPVLDDDIIEARPVEGPDQIEVDVRVHPFRPDEARPGLIPAMDRAAPADKPSKMHQAMSPPKRGPPCRDPPPNAPMKHP
jgi:hypothetical protein